MPGRESVTGDPPERGAGQRCRDALQLRLGPGTDGGRVHDRRVGADVQAAAVPVAARLVLPEGCMPDAVEWHRGGGAGPGRLAQFFRIAAQGRHKSDTYLDIGTVAWILRLPDADDAHERAVVDRVAGGRRDLVAGDQIAGVVDDSTVGRSRRRVAVREIPATSRCLAAPASSEHGTGDEHGQPRGDHVRSAHETS